MELGEITINSETLSELGVVLPEEIKNKAKMIN